MLCHYLSDQHSAMTRTERGVPGLGKVLQSSVCFLEISQNTVLNHTHTETNCVPYVTFNGAESLGTCLMVNRRKDKAKTEMGRQRQETDTVC